MDTTDIIKIVAGPIVSKLIEYGLSASAKHYSKGNKTKIDKYNAGILEANNGEDNIEKNLFKNIKFDLLEYGLLKEKKDGNLPYEYLLDKLLLENVKIVVVGEAGIGKTILTECISKSIVNKNIDSEGIYIPILIKLREYSDSEPENIRIEIGDIKTTFDKIDEINVKNEIKFILIVDGYNEIDIEKRKKWTRAISNKYSKKNYSILITTRNVNISSDIDDSYGDEKTLYYEIQRWNSKQVESYLKKNGINADGIPNSTKSILDVPLWASLFVKSKLSNAYNVSKTKILDRFVRLEAVSVHRPEYLINDKENNMISEMAYLMTKNNCVLAYGHEIVDWLLELNPKYIENDIERVINKCLYHSILASTESVPLQENVEISEIKKKRCAFYHQALQEYLAANHWCNKMFSKEIIKNEVSNNAFWRDVPLYACEIIEETKQDVHKKLNDLIEIFIDYKDYWTATRLSNRIQNREIKIKIQNKLFEKLVERLSTADSYQFIEQAFKELGKVANEKLLEMLKKSNTLTSIISVPELMRFQNKKREKKFKSLKEKLFKAQIDYEEITQDILEESIEKEWRKLGRIMTIILAEVEEMALVEEIILEKIDKIKSLHLLYHMFESILYLLQSKTVPHTLHHKVQQKIDTIQKKMQKNGRLKLYEDPIVKAYITMLRVRNDPSIPDVEEEEECEKLTDYLYKRCQPEGTKHFDNEFWIRAHGIIVLSEMNKTNNVLKIMKKAIQVECDYNRTPYNDASFEGWKAVLSAITLSLYRMQSRGAIKFETVKDLIDNILVKDRYAESKWACQRLEQLLVKMCGEENMQWVVKWRENEKLPSGTKEIINNLAFFMGV